MTPSKELKIYSEIDESKCMMRLSISVPLVSLTAFTIFNINSFTSFHTFENVPGDCFSRIQRIYIPPLCLMISLDVTLYKRNKK